ncbi:MAG: hypothetical protein QM658_09230 [Gordonia sp. (in: high G+C Gram-positive bacteria)]
MTSGENGGGHHSGSGPDPHAYDVTGVAPIGQGYGTDPSLSYPTAEDPYAADPYASDPYLQQTGQYANSYPSGQYPPQYGAYGIGQLPPVQYPPGQYPVARYGQGGSSKAVPIVLGVVIVVLLAFGGFLLWQWQSGDDGTQAGAPGVTDQQTAPQQPAVTTPVDPAVALRQQADTDRTDLAGSLNNRWSAQLSAKQVGLFAEGRTWDAAAIMSEHQSLRQRFPQARLLWSSEWPVFDNQGWWVTTNAQGFATPYEANAWCRSQGFDKDHCFAKLISTTASSVGSTVYQR